MGLPVENLSWPCDIISSLCRRFKLHLGRKPETLLKFIKIPILHIPLVWGLALGSMTLAKGKTVAKDEKKAEAEDEKQAEAKAAPQQHKAAQPANSLLFMTPAQEPKRGE